MEKQKKNNWKDIAFSIFAVSIFFLVMSCSAVKELVQNEPPVAKTPNPDFAPVSPTPTPTTSFSVYQSNSSGTPTPTPIPGEELATLFPIQVGSFTRNRDPRQDPTVPYGSVHQLYSMYKTSEISEDLVFGYYKFSMPSYQKSSSVEQAKYYMDLRIREETTVDTSLPISSQGTKYRIVSRKTITDGEVVSLQNLPQFAKSEQVWIRSGDTLRNIVIMAHGGHAEEFANAYLSQ